MTEEVKTNKKEASETSPEMRIFVEMEDFEAVLREAFHKGGSVEIISCSGRTVQPQETK